MFCTVAAVCPGLVTVAVLTAAPAEAQVTPEPDHTRFDIEAPSGAAWAGGSTCLMTVTHTPAEAALEGARDSAIGWVSHLQSVDQCLPSDLRGQRRLVHADRLQAHRDGS